MPQIDVNCPYCNDEHTVEIKNQSDGDIEEIECACGKSFDVEISFSVNGIIYKKDALSEDIEWVLNFCPKCNQMTNHEKAGQCLKCKSKRHANQKESEVEDGR